MYFCFNVPKLLLVNLINDNIIKSTIGTMTVQPTNMILRNLTDNPANQHDSDKSQTNLSLY